jgi:predicted nucleic acid-binding protein
MTFSSSLDGCESVLVLDASVLINLIGSRHSDRILASLPAPAVVSEYAAKEILEGGHGDAVVIQHLLDRGLLARQLMSPAAASLFEGLVSGATHESLGDGEAATIAIAHDIGAVALIDEKQGWRIAGVQFPDLQLATTVDLFALPTIGALLGPTALGEAVHGAIVQARMQVREHQLEWVIARIGVEAASECRSLARLMRNRASSARRTA